MNETDFTENEPPNSAHTDIFVARQPIFNRDLKVHGFELLYRSSTENSFDGTHASTATSRVIANAFLSIGAEKLLNGKPAFINFDAEMLALEYATLLPFRSIVVEILETVEPRPEVLEACARLKGAGYTIALDDFTEEANIKPWLQLVDIIKVDFLRANAESRERILRQHGGGRFKFLAEKLETEEDYQQAVRLKFDYYQGFFFARPTVIAGRSIPETKLTLLRLLREVSPDEVHIDRLEKLIQQEVSLSYKLLRYVNSAAFGWRAKIKSVRHAIALLGEDEIRKWICLLLVVGLSDQKPAAILVKSLVRARFGELLSPKMRLGKRKSSIFLLGLFSHLDVILNCPMQEAIQDLHLEDDMVNALLDRSPRSDALGNLHVLVRAYDSADWVRAAAIAQDFRIVSDQLTDAYVQAVQWADLVAAT